MTSQPLYMKPHPVCRATYTLYMRHHSHYLCSHTHCIDNITPTLCMTSHSPYVWHLCTIQDNTTSLYDLKPQFLCHHTHYIWHRVHCICVITSTLLMISHQLYFWDHIHYNSRHHIHCMQHDSHWICVITATRSMISRPFYAWNHTHYMYNIIYPIKGITPIFYEITPRCVWHDMHCILDITPSISDTTSTLSVWSRPVY